MPLSAHWQARGFVTEVALAEGARNRMRETSRPQAGLEGPACWRHWQAGMALSLMVRPWPRPLIIGPGEAATACQLAPGPGAGPSESPASRCHLC